MYDNSYLPMINRPTRVTRLIDNIFTNDYSINDDLFNGILKADITDHFILFHIIKGNYHDTDKNNESELVRIINDSRIRQFTEKNSKYWLVFIEFIHGMSNILLKILHIV